MALLLVQGDVARGRAVGIGRGHLRQLARDGVHVPRDDVPVLLDRLGAGVQDVAGRVDPGERWVHHCLRRPSLVCVHRYEGQLTVRRVQAVRPHGVGRLGPRRPVGQVVEPGVGGYDNEGVVHRSVVVGGWWLSG